MGLAELYRCAHGRSASPARNDKSTFLSFRLRVNNLTEHYRQKVKKKAFTGGDCLPGTPTPRCNPTLELHPYRASAPVTRRLISSSLVFRRRWFTGPVRSNIFWPADNDSSAGSVNS